MLEHTDDASLKKIHLNTPHRFYSIEQNNYLIFLVILYANLLFPFNIVG